MSAKQVQAEEATLSLSQVEEMMSRLIAEMRKPAEMTEVEKAEWEAKRARLEQELEERKAQADLIKLQLANKRALQMSCIHTRRDGSTPAVHIVEPIGPGYLICQACQGMIRPGNPPENDEGQFIYDTALFNRLMQLTMPAIF